MSDIENLMKQFCNIVMPGHNNKRGYINVKKKVEDLNVDRRTYYHWKNGDVTPRLKKFVKLLDERGFDLKIVPSENAYRDN